MAESFQHPFPQHFVEELARSAWQTSFVLAMQPVPHGVETPPLSALRQQASLLIGTFGALLMHHAVQQGVWDSPDAAWAHLDRDGSQDAGNPA